MDQYSASKLSDKVQITAGQQSHEQIIDFDEN